MSDKFDSHDGHTQYHPENLHKTISHKEHYEVTECKDAAPIEVPIKMAQNTSGAQKPSIGRIVHFVLDGGPNKGQHRPAMIVRIWDANPTIHSLVQLQVFTDGSNDGELYRSGLYWATSVHYADPSENKIYSWHWPERI